MDYNISEQIGTWTNKLDYYKSKESLLKQRIADTESKRESVNRLPVGSPFVDKFYRQLNSLYTQLANLSIKVCQCKNNIITLQRELKWS